MTKRVVFHVVPSSEGWSVNREGASRASSNHQTKAEAVDRARGFAQSESLGQVKIHGTDGRIQEERTYGKDPYPPKG